MFSEAAIGHGYDGEELEMDEVILALAQESILGGLIVNEYIWGGLDGLKENTRHASAVTEEFLGDRIML